MDFRAVAGNITEVPVGALVVNLFEGVETPSGGTGAVDRALDGAISALIADGEIKGKKGELTLIHTLGKLPSARVVVVGLGKQADFNAEVVRVVTASSSRYLRKLGVRQAATLAHGAGIGGLAPEASAQAMAEGAHLGLYTFKKYFSKDGDDDNGKTLDELQIIEQDQAKLPALQAGIDRGRIVAEAVLLARDLVNEPASVMTPTRMAEVAQEMAQQQGLEIDVIDALRMEELGMGMLLAVARGSHQPPKMIVLRYAGDPDNADNNLGLVGKGITFDSGGISLKSAGGMWEMKGDMSGAAAVIGAMQAIAQLKPRINVTAIAPCTENMPGGSAQRPGDVIRAMNGKTAEVDNTDAEGRLILADALSYARTMDLKRLVDVATLTGAITVALGDQATGRLHQQPGSVRHGGRSRQPCRGTHLAASDVPGVQGADQERHRRREEHRRPRRWLHNSRPLPGRVQRGHALGTPRHSWDVHFPQGEGVQGEGGHRDAGKDAGESGDEFERVAQAGRGGGECSGRAPGLHLLPVCRPRRLALQCAHPTTEGMSLNISGVPWHKSETSLCFPSTPYFSPAPASPSKSLKSATRRCCAISPLTTTASAWC